MTSLWFKTRMVVVDNICLFSQFVTRSTRFFRKRDTNPYVRNIRSSGSYRTSGGEVMGTILGCELITGLDQYISIGEINKAMKITKTGKSSCDDLILNENA